MLSSKSILRNKKYTSHAPWFQQFSFTQFEMKYMKILVIIVSVVISYWHVLIKNDETSPSLEFTKSNYILPNLMCISSSPYCEDESFESTRV